MATAKKTDYVILGLLSHEPLTGYDIKQRMDTSLSLFWGASYGSIYPALEGLLRDKKIKAADVSTNGREKTQYTITAKGKKYLKQWLSEPVEKDELRSETLLKLFFGSCAEPSDSLAHVEAFRKTAERTLAVLHQMEASLEPVLQEDPAHRYYLLTVRCGIRMYEAYAAWCDEAEDELHDGQGTADK
ncbi:MAG: PadR family transcriptional regulator [Treponema sp.]|nr:PadR family transcriptional regulator [Treponema sp.]